MPKRDYHKSKYAVMRDERHAIEKEKKSFKKVIFVFIFFIIIIAIIYWLIFSPFFQIKKIHISGTNRVEEITQIENMVQEFLMHNRFFVLSQKNVFVLSKSGLKNVINNRFDLETINLNTDLPDILMIEIKHKVPALIWQEGDNYFTIYNDGVIKNKLDNVSEFELAIVNRGTSTEVVIGGQYVSDEQLNYIQKIFSLFNFHFKDLNVQQFVLTSLESREIKLITNEAWYILFNIDLDAQESLETVKAVLEQKVEDRASLQYVDARIKDKIYYR